MENIIMWMKDLFLGEETSGTIVGLSDFKEKQPVLQSGKTVKKEIKQLKLSELMRKSSY